MAEHAPLVYGKYQLLELLARGGMAEVFKAKSHGVEGFEKVLVIKRILADLGKNPEFVEMFINEAKIAVTLSHANIVQVFDLGRADETYFIAMEFVAGSDLATALRRSRKYAKPLARDLSAYIVSEVAKGLDYAHRRRDAQMEPLHIVHRDVSPQNVLLSWEGEVKLTDFGIAKARTTVESGTEAGVLKGKYAYMSPEQARGEDVDGRTDIFALGTVLYESIAGENPFDRGSTYETLRAVRDGRTPTLAQRRWPAGQGVSPELSAIVAGAMAPDRSERYENAGRLYEELIQFLYASGRRIGARDLSSYLDDLRMAGERGRGSTDERRLRAAFGNEPAVVHQDGDATPTEIPRPRGASTPGVSGAARPITTGAGRPGTGVGRPQSEARDVTALVLSMAPDDPLPNGRIRQLIQRAGGLVTDQSVGESTSISGRTFVAVFGAREPDGRDPEAAAKAALALLTAAHRSTEGAHQSSTSIGLHSGRVLVDIAGELLRDEHYLKLLEETRAVTRRAPEGVLLADPAAARGLRRLFELEAAPGGEDVLVRGELDAEEALGRFVGRQTELRRISEVLAFANKGRMRVLSLMGEAGSGKSRALKETRRRLRLGGHDVGMYIAQVSRQARDVPLSGFQEMLRVVLGVDELDGDAVVRAKAARLRELGLPRPEVLAVESLLGLRPEEGEDVPAVLPMQAAIAHIATRLAQDRLTVFAFDGAESMDEESMAMLYRLATRAEGARLVILLAQRPGHVHAFQDLPIFEEVDLAPFDDEDVARLTAIRLGVEEVPMELLREVVGKSGGNPLYVEEYLRALEEAGAVDVSSQGKVAFHPEVAAVEVPKTLMGIVAARLSRIGGLERHLLRIAAILGEGFSSALLARIADEDPATVEDALRSLAEQGVVLRRPGGDYQFTHDMVQRVLVDGLPIESRRELHLAAATGLEALYPGRVDELAERLAAHYREAGERARAIDYLVRAADRHEAEYALGVAVTDLESAIRLLGQMKNPDRERMLALYQRVGELAYRGQDLLAGAERMAAATELADGIGRMDYVARFCMMRGRLLAHANQLNDSRHWLDRARRVARDLDSPTLLRDVTVATAETDVRNGDYIRATSMFQEALALARDASDRRAQVRCLIPLALALGGSNMRDEALAALAEARALVRGEPDRFTECELLKTESLVQHFCGSVERSAELAEQALELAKEYGFAQEACVNAHNLGEDYMRMGDYKRAFALLRYSFETAREHGLSKMQYTNMRVLGFIDAVKFGSDEGRDRILEALVYAEENNYLWDIVQGRYMLALVDALAGDEEAARAGFREVMRLSDEHGQKTYGVQAGQALRALDEGRPVPLPS